VSHVLCDVPRDAHLKPYFDGLACTNEGNRAPLSCFASLIALTRAGIKHEDGRLIELLVFVKYLVYVL
jgi:hypothetical protein